MKADLAKRKPVREARRRKHMATGAADEQKEAEARRARQAAQAGVGSSATYSMMLAHEDG